MPRCCCWRFSLSTFGWCCCCCTVPTANERLPLLDIEKKIPSSYDDIHINEIFVPTSYISSKNKSLSRSRLRVVTISDTHMHHMKYKMPAGDILIIAGDFTNWKTTASNTESVIPWIASLKQYTYKLIIAGNHEVGIKEDDKTETADMFKKRCNAIYLQDDEFDAFGLKFYGTPWHPKRGCFFHAEAFAKPTKELVDTFGAIPSSTDILITHVPPYGIRDNETAGHIGSYSLLDNCINRVKPIMHIFGHVHGTNGISLVKETNTTFVNTATKLNVFDLIFQHNNGQYDTPLIVKNKQNQKQNSTNNDNDDYKIEMEEKKDDDDDDNDDKGLL